MSNNFLIYCLLDLQESQAKVKYVGITQDIEKRIKSHLSACNSAKKPNLRLSNWILTQREKGVLHYEILEEIDYKDKINKINAEKKWIAYFRSIENDLFNISDGGEGVTGKSSPEKNLKISVANKGRVVSQEHRDKISKALTGRKYSFNINKSIAVRTRLLENNWNLGLKRTPEQRERQIEILTSGYVTKRRIKALKARAKKCVVTFPSGEILKVNNLNEFCKDYNLDYGSMNKVANGKQGRTQHKGFLVKWR